MPKNDTSLIKLAKNTVKSCLRHLLNDSKSKKNFFFDPSLQKEVKLNTDFAINKIILHKLSNTDIPIISEEGSTKNYQFKKDKVYWVVDPIDGSFNFLRNILSCSISIALYCNNKILFGVIGEYPSGDIYWGGKKYGSYFNKRKIKCSNIKEFNNAVLATGFPSRFKFSNKNLLTYIKYIKIFAKIRMIGSASLSLINLSSGKFDAYYEQNIMFWDIAAGLAILEGAGGTYSLNMTKDLICEVKATNNSLNFING